MKKRKLGKSNLEVSAIVNENTKLDGTDFRSTLPRFTPEAMKAVADLCETNHD